PDGIADDEDGLLERERLLDEVVRAHLDRAHRRLDVAVARNHDPLGVDLALPQAGQRGEPIHPGQPDIEHDDVEALARDAFEAGLARLDRLDVVLLVSEHAAERRPDAGFVVDDEDAGVGHGRTTDYRSTRQFNREPRAARRVVRHVDAPAVLGDDPADDRETQPAAPAFGREVRHEKPLHNRTGGAPTVARPDYTSAG